MTATLADGTRLRARVLVAAEGAESPVRKRLGIAFEGRDYAQRAVVAHVATERPHAGTAWQRFQPGGPLAFLPLADGRCSIVWSLPEADAVRVLALAPTAVAGLDRSGVVVDGSGAIGSVHGGAGASGAGSRERGAVGDRTYFGRGRGAA